MQEIQSRPRARVDGIMEGAAATGRPGGPNRPAGWGFSAELFLRWAMPKERNKALAVKLAVADSGTSKCSREHCSIGAVAIGSLACVIDWCEFQITVVGSLMDAEGKSVPDVLGLKGAFPFGGGPGVDGRRGGASRGGVRRCRVCGCTDLKGCGTAGGGSCHWVAEELCSACDAKSGRRRLGPLPAVGGRRGGKSPATSSPAEAPASGTDAKAPRGVPAGQSPGWAK